MSHATAILVSDETRQTLAALAVKENRPADAVLDDAVKAYASRREAVMPEWKRNLLQAAGIWEHRTDLPDFEELRRSADRDVWKRGDDE